MEATLVPVKVLEEMEQASKSWLAKEVCEVLLITNERSFCLYCL
jgi:hypothetical protein